jgi:single-stranded-DNA-specific exonuclease
MDAARLTKPPSASDMGFALGPRINAGGRVGKSDLGVRLLTTTRTRRRPPTSRRNSTG